MTPSHRPFAICRKYASVLACSPLIELDTHPEGWRDRPVEAPATSWETRCQLRQVRESEPGR